MLGLRFCARAFSSCGKRGPLFIMVRGPLTIAASLVAEHRLQTRRLSSCGSRAQSLRGMWDLPRPGLEPVSPALAGRFSTTAPPGKPWDSLFWVLDLLSNLPFHTNVRCWICPPDFPTCMGMFLGSFPLVSVTSAASMYTVLCCPCLLRPFCRRENLKASILPSLNLQWLAFSCVWWSLWKHPWL